MSSDFYIFKSKWLECIGGDLDLPDSACRLALAIGRFLNSESADAWPSIATLANRTGHTERNIQRILKMLVQRGYLTISNGGGRGATNLLRPRMKGDSDLGEASRHRADYVKKPRPQSWGLDEKPRPQSHPFTYKNGDSTVAKTPTVERPKPNEGTLTSLPSKFAPAVVSSFDEFERRWNWQPTESRGAARRAFDEVVSAEQQRAIDAVPSYVRECALGGERLSASRWLRGRCYLNLTPIALSSRTAGPIVTEHGVFVRISSAQWSAWRAAEGQLESVNTAFGVGCYRPTEWPPGREPGIGGAPR